MAVTEAKLTLKGFMEELIPSLMAAGMTEQEVRLFGTAWTNLMGEGGYVQDWVMTAARLIAVMDAPRLYEAFERAFDAWEASIPGRPDA